MTSWYQPEFIHLFRQIPKSHTWRNPFWAITWGFWSFYILYNFYCQHELKNWSSTFTYRPCNLGPHQHVQGWTYPYSCNWSLYRTEICRMVPWKGFWEMVITQGLLKPLLRRNGNSHYLSILNTPLNISKANIFHLQRSFHHQLMLVVTDNSLFISPKPILIKGLGVSWRINSIRNVYGALLVHHTKAKGTMRIHPLLSVRRGNLAGVLTPAGREGDTASRSQLQNRCFRAAKFKGPARERLLGKGASNKAILQQKAYSSKRRDWGLFTTLVS